MSSLPQATGQCPPKEEKGQGAGAVGRSGHLTSGGETASGRRAGRHHSPPHVLPLMVLPAARTTETFFFLFCFQSNIVFMPGLVIN